MNTKVICIISKKKGWHGQRKRHSIVAKRAWAKKRKKKKRPPFRISKKMKKVTHKQYIYQDFDKDGMANLDDIRPFDKHINTPVDKDSRYTKELRKIERVRKEHLPYARATYKELRKKFPHRKGYYVTGRIKTVPSVINKMNRKYLDKGKVRSKVPKVRAKVTNVEDFYNQEKKPYYKAVHYDIVMGKDKLPGEIQLKTERQRRLHLEMHKGHKTGRDTGKMSVKTATHRAELRNKLDKKGKPVNVRKKDFWANFT